MTFSIVQRTFLAPESIRLGRFVRNIEDPNSDFLDPDLGVPAESLIVQSHLDYSEVQHNSKERTFKATLTSLISASRAKSKNFRTHVQTDQLKTYQLSNSGPWFRSAIQSTATRDWIREAIDYGDDMYVVVGYHTMKDARIFDYVENRGDISAWLELPIEEALAAAGVGIMLGGVANPGAQVQDSHMEGNTRRFVAVGEQICAVQYRKIHVKIFSSRDLDKASLERNNFWKNYLRARGQEAGVNDVVETDLSDDLENLDDLDVEGDYERHLYGKEEFLV
ncbi:hypothetical protein N7456_007410 [Penicillium angulare]|uniref:Uncharacterized protein n=1 Tax=Penicillium angulare TaxID=116970 RepID=A0A9W9K856_9EURO|nr:hypothetical protein N7456_007410 [Penicillium angulare]